MKKSIIISILFILFVLTGCSSKTKDYGKFYDLKDAYDNNVISYDDLLSIAYHNNGGREGNEEYIPLEFIPKAIDNVISKDLKRKIISTKANSAEEYDSYSITSYYGTYNDAIIIKMRSSLYEITTDVTTLYVEGIKFVFPTESITVFVGY
ncbi:MAG: hypothetical protein ACI35W_00055 [Anaeroplasmataceae bacterium]